MIDCDLQLTSRDTLLISSLASQLNSSVDTIHRLDQKATNVVLLANAVIGFFGISRFETYVSVVVNGNNPSLVFLVIVLGFIYLALMGTFITTIRPQWKSTGVIKSDWDEVTDWRSYDDRTSFLDNVYSTYIEACIDNRKVVTDKAKSLTTLYVCLSLMVVFLLLSSVYLRPG